MNNIVRFPNKEEEHEETFLKNAILQFFKAISSNELRLAKLIRDVMEHNLPTRVAKLEQEIKDIKENM